LLDLAPLAEPGENPAMPRVRQKGPQTPDEIRDFSNGTLQMVSLHEIAIGGRVVEQRGGGDG